MLFTGLIAGNLWADRSVTISIGQWRITPRMAYGPIAMFFLYITLARAFGASALAAFGVGTRLTDVPPSGLGAVGSAACVIGYLALGATLRIVAERDGQKWILTAFRLWGVRETSELAVGEAIEGRRHTSRRQRIAGTFSISAFVSDASGRELKRISRRTLSPKLVIKVENMSTVPREIRVMVRAEYGLISFGGSNSLIESITRLPSRGTKVEEVDFTFSGTYVGMEVLTLSFYERRSSNSSWIQSDRNPFRVEIDVVR
jgi:hypothetical protein